MNAFKRVLIYTIPVASFSVLLNIPKFFETQVLFSDFIETYDYKKIETPLTWIVSKIILKPRSATAMRLGWFTMYPSTVWHQTTFGGTHWVFCFTQLWRLRLFQYLHSCFSTTRYTSKVVVYKLCNDVDKTKSRKLKFIVNLCWWLWFLEA